MEGVGTNTILIYWFPLTPPWLRVRKSLRL
nr:MAG TPA: hypothetical protein [Microviridae sp.]